MSYVDEVYERVVRENPSQPEFHQAVREVLDSLRPVIERNEEKYRREALLDLVWGYDYQGDTRTVDVHIRRLREKLELNPAQPEYIITKWGVGYYFAD